MFTQKLLQLIECALTERGKYGFHLGSAEQFTASIILCWQAGAMAPDPTPSRLQSRKTGVTGRENVICSVIKPCILITRIYRVCVCVCSNRPLSHIYIS